MEKGHIHGKGHFSSPSDTFACAPAFRLGKKEEERRGDTFCHRGKSYLPPSFFKGVT